MSVVAFTFAERPDLASRAGELPSVWPEFLHHSESCRRHWHLLDEAFPHLQVTLYDEAGDVVVGWAHTVPARWDDGAARLPGGVDEVMDGAPAVASGAAQPDVLSALVAAVVPERRGGGLAALILTTMRALAARHGLPALVAPIRPTLKHRYPLVPLDAYAAWRRADGQPYDPWIRAHARLGAETLGIAARSLTIRGSVGDWERWTGMDLPGSGDHVVPGALVPVRVDRDRDVGEYVEPNLWMRHAAG